MIFFEQKTTFSVALVVLFSELIAPLIFHRYWGLFSIFVVEQALSFEEYLHYIDGTDNRYELVLGKLELVNPPTVRHFLIAKYLEQLLDREINKKNCNWLCFREAGIRTGWQKSRLLDLLIIDKSAAMELLDTSAVFPTPPNFNY